ncbi:MAG: ABC transporter permease [Sedimentisphaerales bacterium]|nr:ABC transporter permease [Sedimentisphaerales bacterium]
MRTPDYIEQAWANLWKKKLRTFLTTCGVVIGIGALVTMFAFGQGVQRNIKKQFEELELFNYITASVSTRRHPGQAEFDPDGVPMDHRPADANERAEPLDAQALREIMRIPGVEAAFPEMKFPAQVQLGDDEQFTLVQVLSADAANSGLIALRAGEPYATDEPNEVIISDMMLRRLDLREPESAIGKQLDIRTLVLDLSLGNLMRIAFLRGGQSLPISNRTYSFTIVGVAERMGMSGPLPIRSDVMIPPGPAEGMKKLELTSIWDFFQPSDKPGTYSTVSVKVASPSDIPAVEQKLHERGLRTFALIDQMDQMQTAFIIMDVFLLAVGMIGITVASLGIVNTMVMSILERYREIGIMKAVGATNGDVQRIFFYESGMIGLLGGVFGLLLARVVSFVINQVINGVASGQGVPFIHYFDFSWWLCLAAILFSILVSLLAGVYPTLRAARVDPVVALRHD